jgi:hypothetical protein
VFRLDSTAKALSSSIYVVANELQSVKDDSEYRIARAVPSGMWLELRGAISSNVKVSDQAARSIG